MRRNGAQNRGRLGHYEFGGLGNEERDGKIFLIKKFWEMKTMKCDVKDRLDRTNRTLVTEKEETNAFEDIAI